MTQKTATITPELRGMGVLLGTLLLLLSLLRGQAHDLGVVGYAVGWFFQFTFGLGSFMIVGYLIWWGWRMLTGKLPERPRRELIWFSTLLLSVNVLLSVVSVAWPTVAAFCRPLIYSDTMTHVAPLAYSEVRYPPRRPPPSTSSTPTFPSSISAISSAQSAPPSSSRR